MKKLTFGFLLMIVCSSCYYDVEEELYLSIECSTTDMSYQNDILPIISNNCFNCHNAASNFGGVTLEGFSTLKTYVDNGQLLGVIKHESGFSPMPKNSPKLLECEIEKIDAWINSGAPNN